MSSPSDAAKQFAQQLGNWMGNPCQLYPIGGTDAHRADLEFQSQTSAALPAVHSERRIQA